jgi:hypothetical protein
MSGVGFAKLPTMKTLPTCFASNSCYRLFTILWLLFAFISLRAYPPESEESQTRRADVIAWCDVVSIEILEKPRVELGMSSQLRNFTLRVVESLKGEMPRQTNFSLRFAEYEVFHTKDLKHIIQPEILVWEIHRRPRIEVGKQYKVYLRKNGDGVEPLNGRWSILHSRVDPRLYEKWTGEPEKTAEVR